MPQPASATSRNVLALIGNTELTGRVPGRAAGSGCRVGQYSATTAIFRTAPASAALASDMAPDARPNYGTAFLQSANCDRDASCDPLSASCRFQADWHSAINLV